MDIFKEFTFEAAHFLPAVPEGHKCRQLHGHSYHIQLTVRGPVKATEGWVMDFGDLKRAFGPLYDQLDHHFLNAIPGLENPTSENIARWIFRNLQPALPELCRVTIRETCTSGCSFDGSEP